MDSNKRPLTFFWVCFWLIILGLLWLEARAEVGCPEGQVGYDIAAGEYLYGHPPPTGNDFGVSVEGQGSISWLVKQGCDCTAICVWIDGDREWPESVNEGTWQGGEHIVFWGGCQVPGPMPPQNWIPLMEAFW